MVCMRMIVHMARTMVTEPQPVKVRVIADLRAAFGEVKCIGSERLVRLGISMTQLHVLNLLNRHGEMAMSRLAEMLDVSMSAATGLVDRVEEHGYVERIRVPSDRRIVLARITVNGRQLLDDIDSVQTEILDRILDGLDEAQLTRLAAAMVDLRTAVDALVTDHASGAYHTHQPQGRN
jgi:DNA-binding MarR family transcriptional regulator